MAFTFAGYEAASRPTDSASPGARALMAYCLRRWGFATNLGIYAPRNVRGGSSLSHHAEGRALDIGIPVLTPSRADAAKGMQIADALGPHGRRLGIDHLIYNRIIWSARTPAGRPYTGVAPHYDHIHLGLTRKSGANLTLATVVAVVGSLGDTTDGPEPAELTDVTHRVTASSLRLRLRPSTSGSLVGGLPRGAEVATEPDPPVDNDGHQWVKVRALVDGRPERGWVASEYLEPVSPTPTPPEPSGPTLESATHRVTASSLRLRPEPTTSSDPITSLPNGTTVEQLPDRARHNDGHQWVRIRALVDGRPREGWVASEYLEPVSPEPTEPEPSRPTLERATHRVTASSLRLRPEPTTSADPITSLPNGTTVEQLPDPARDNDGHQWVKVRAVIDGRTREGWVASQYLEPLA